MVDETKNDSNYWGSPKTTIFSKDTLDIRTTTDTSLLPLKSCIQIPHPNGSGEKLNVKKAKSVHFADSLGKPLKSIKTLYDLEDDLDLTFFKFCKGGGGGYTNKRTFSVNIKSKQQAKKNKFDNFSLPIPCNTFKERLQKENVLLESIIFRDYGIFGTVHVKNISFEKEVSVTFTVDDWATVQKTYAKYVPGSSSGTTDIFAFEINVPEEKKKNSSKIQFAICYSTSNNSFWDSNSSKNYIVSFSGENSSKKNFLDADDNYNGFIIPKQNFIGWAS